MPHKSFFFKLFQMAWEKWKRQQCNWTSGNTFFNALICQRAKSHIKLCGLNENFSFKYENNVEKVFSFSFVINANRQSIVLFFVELYPLSTINLKLLLFGGTILYVQSIKYSFIKLSFKLLSKLSFAIITIFNFLLLLFSLSYSIIWDILFPSLSKNLNIPFELIIFSEWIFLFPYILHWYNYQFLFFLSFDGNFLWKISFAFIGHKFSSSLNNNLK